MGNNNGMAIILVIILAVVLYFFVFKHPTGLTEMQYTEGDLIRGVPVSDADGKFTVEYSSERAGTWGAIIVDNIIQGDCTFSNGKKIYKSVMLGDGPTQQTVEVTGTNCVFKGDYNFVSSSGSEQVQVLAEQTVK